MEERDQVLATRPWQEHLADCPDCAAALKDDQLLRRVLTAQPVAHPSPDLAGKILTAWLKEHQNNTPGEFLPAPRVVRTGLLLSGVRQRMVALIAGLAACTLLMLQSPLRNNLSGLPLGMGLTQQQSDSKDEQSLLSAMRGVYQSVAKAGLVSPQFTQPTVDAVLPEFSASVNSDLAEMTSQEMIKPLTELKDELHPLGEKVSQAVGFLWKTIPADESL